MTHLESLKLAEKAEESGANALGDAIRSYLRRIYNVDDFGTTDRQARVVTDGADRMDRDLA